MALFNITRWPAVLVFCLAGAVAILFAFLTVNLFTLTMASVDFLREYGWRAIQHGALWQVAELMASGAVALILWLIFKTCETELTYRYLRWARGTRRDMRLPADATDRDA